MVLTTQRKVTEAEYLALPETKPYLEFVFGEVRQKAMPNTDHVEIVDAVAAMARAYRQAQRGSHAGPEPRVRFETERGREYRLPDYAYWAPGRPFLDAGEMMPPTLAVEVRSPDETMTAQREKCRYYRRYGVAVCWLFDPASRTVEVFEEGRDGDP
ncbi:MAG: Uma2 family endonuclease, partial [Dehalococcoidia bacterium]